MPELPEVETIKNGLKILKGKTLEKFKIYKDGWRRPVPIDALNKLRGKKVIDTHRRAKWLAIVFDTGCLWFHLGMSGQIKLTQQKQNEPLHKHDHLEIIFDSTILRFQDHRRFGMVDWTDGAYSEPPSREFLGYEPFDIKWTGEIFYEQMKKIKTPIKIVLMNSKLVVGVGNIYASESLFKSQILPIRPANSLSKNEAFLLRESIIDILKDSILKGGSTLKDHRTIDGDIGHFQDEHLVYGKENKPCKVCGDKIKKIEQAGRSTFYCNTCQH